MDPVRIFPKDKEIKFNPSPHSPHTIILNLIPPKSVNLDIGCNSGSLGKALKRKRVIIDGIDVDRKILKKAKPFYRHLYYRNLYRPKLCIPKTKYDSIIMADILEHLPRPDLLLVDIKKYLKPDGQIIVSLPNIARLEIRLQLLFGSFNYSPGILNPDHLKFFTKKSAHNLFESTGYTIIKIIPSGLGHQLPILPTLLAFQFIFIAKLKHA